MPDDERQELPLVGARARSSSASSATWRTGRRRPRVASPLVRAPAVTRSRRRARARRPEPGRARSRPTEPRRVAPRVDRTLDVDDRAAAAAGEVMVLVGARVVDDGAALRGDAVDQPDRLEQLERRVHGGSETPGMRRLTSSNTISADTWRSRSLTTRATIRRCGVTRWPRSRRAVARLVSISHQLSAKVRFA